MGDTRSPRCGYTGSPNHNLGATDPGAPVSFEPCFCLCITELSGIDNIGLGIELELNFLKDFVPDSELNWNFYYRNSELELNCKNGIFYSWSKHKHICTVRQYSGSLAHPRGMYCNGKEGRTPALPIAECDYAALNLNAALHCQKRSNTIAQLSLNEQHSGVAQ